MSIYRKIPIEFWAENFEYDPDTGIVKQYQGLTKYPREVLMIVNEHYTARVKYKDIRIGFKAHRIAFILMTGRYQKEGYVIHHKDFNPLNNKWDNLVELTRSAHTSIHSRKGSNRPATYKMGGKTFKAASKEEAKAFIEKNHYNLVVNKGF